jgi:nucleotidyltransferase AbiEii toxin of type IV toxin-antitoxin system
MLEAMEPRTLEAIVRLTARERLLIASSRGAPMDESPDKLAALADVIRALDGLGVPHAVVGGVAVGVRSGVPRATLDTDIAVRSSAEPGSITAALTRAGLRLTGTFTHSMNFRHPSGEPVQIVFDPEFDPMIERAEPLDVAGVRIRVVTTADLIAMKERAASDPARRRSKALRDRADIALLRGDVPDPDEGW